MTERHAIVERETAETHIKVSVRLEGRGTFRGSTGLAFFEHMLQLVAYHARTDLEIDARGDLEVDDHHLVEDVAITLGQALVHALGDKQGIERYGFVLLPMDDVLVAVALDLSGRFTFACDYSAQREKLGDLSTELVPHFFRTLAMEVGCNLHFQFLNPGVNEHHRIEAMFKGFARSLRMAVRISAENKQEVPSTKGVL